MSIDDAFVLQESEKDDDGPHRPSLLGSRDPGTASLIRRYGIKLERAVWGWWANRQSQITNFLG